MIEVLEELGDVFTVGVFGAVFKKGKILLVRKSDSGKWGLPGGRVNWEEIYYNQHLLVYLEDLEFVFWKALKREIFEETGINLLPRPKDKGKVFISENKNIKDLAFLYLIYLDSQPPEVINFLGDSEISGIKWFPIEEEEIERLELIGPRMKEMILYAIKKARGA